MKTLFTIFCLSLSILSFGQNSFFSIRTSDSHLVRIDTLGNVSDIGFMGHQMNYYASLTYFKDTLYCINNDSLYTVNPVSGLVSLRCTLKESTNGNPLYSSRLAFTHKGVAFLFNELSTYPEGTLYRLNLNTGVAVSVSANTSGDPSILAIAFDKNDVLLATSEWGNNMMTLDTITGQVTNAKPTNSLGMEFSNTLCFNNKGQLWGIDINNEYTFDHTYFNIVDVQAGTGTVKFTLSGNYSGMAWAPVVTPTGIANKQVLSKSQVFPNPNNGFFKVRLPENLTNVEFRLTDLSGREVGSKLELINGIYEPKNQLAQGSYLLQTLAEGHVFSTNLIIVK